MTKLGETLEGEDGNLRKASSLDELIVLKGVSQAKRIASERNEVIIFIISVLIIAFVVIEAEVLLVNALARRVLVLRRRGSVGACNWMVKELGRVLLVKS